MGQATDMFWNLLHERWRGEDAEQEARAARSVLVHLRRRLPGTTLLRLEDDLSPEIGELWAEPELEAAREGFETLEKLDYDEFLDRVRTEAELPSREVAETALGAVFHALRRFVNDDARGDLAYQLPAGLKECWLDTAGIEVRAHKGTSGAYGPGGG